MRAKKSRVGVGGSEGFGWIGWGSGGVGRGLDGLDEGGLGLVEVGGGGRLFERLLLLQVFSR